MLEQVKFIQGLKYLNAYYSNFNFDIQDNFKIMTWYAVFETYENDQYSTIIKDYCKANIYPPQSPSSIIEFVKNQVIKTYLQSDEAWLYTIGLLRQKNHVFSRFYQHCEHPLIVETTRTLEPTFIGIHTEDLKYLKINFIKLYEQKVAEESYQKTLKGEIHEYSNRIAHQKTKAIGTDG